MAELTPQPAGLADAVSLDAARDHVGVCLRSCERFTANLQKVLEGLNSTQPGDEWLEGFEKELMQGVQFHEQQAQMWQAFQGRMERYMASLRRQADEWAMDELHANAHPGTEAVTAPVARTLHPELHRFKLEKQAKILGKYGGVPAMGAGLVMPRMPRPGDEGGILKATASPAAREIHYSRAEDRDASQLAKVMRFKSVQQESTPSPWQAEVRDRRGRSQLGHADEAPVTPVVTHTPFAPELSAALQARQAVVNNAELAEKEALLEQRRREKSASVGAPLPELAEKLQRRVAAEAAAAAAAKAAIVAAEEPAAPSTSWSNTAAPFGNELAKALQQRQQQSASIGGASSGEGASGSSDGGATPGKVVSAATTPYRVAPSRSAGPSNVTPAAAAVSNELAEKLRRRQSLIEAVANP